jgi:hypothetical protein
MAAVAAVKGRRKSEEQTKARPEFCRLGVRSGLLGLKAFIKSYSAQLGKAWRFDANPYLTI